MSREENAMDLYHVLSLLLSIPGMLVAILFLREKWWTRHSRH